RQASPSCSQSSQEPRPRQLASASSTAATVVRGGRPEVAGARYPRVGEPSYSDGASNVLESLRVLDGGKITGIFPQRRCSYRTPDDLCAPRLRERGDEDDTIRLERSPELRRGRLGSLGGERVAPLVAPSEPAEDPGDLALHLVRSPDGGGFGLRGMGDDGGLDLRRPDALARDVERVVGSAVQEPVA